MPLLSVATAPEVRSAGLYADGETFPEQPAQRTNVNQEPLPLSPPGTYLHSSVLIQGRMYVYGGVASYDPDQYMNDLWLFDFGSSEFVQLQGNYVPPTPTHAGLSTGEAESFAPRDVPSMPNLATAPRHDRSQVQKLHPDANPISPFLPKRRSQRPVRVMALEHIFAVDADKPTAAGLSMQTLHAALHTPKPAFEIEAEEDAAMRAAALAKATKAAKLLADTEAAFGGKGISRARMMQAKDEFIQATKKRYEKEAMEKMRDERKKKKKRTGEREAKATAFVETETEVDAQTETETGVDADSSSRDSSSDHLSLGTDSRARSTVHHRHRMSMVTRALRAAEDARLHKNPRVTQPGLNAGTTYSDVRHHRDGVAADYATKDDQRPVQESATQQHYANTAHPTSAAPNARDFSPHALHDFWSYDFDRHSWSVVNVTSSQPLAHSPWLTPAQLRDPVFKDPLAILLPPTRRLHTAVAMKDRMIVFGGVSYNNLILGDLWIFDPAESSWIEASADGPGGSPILPREGHSAVTLNDGLTMLVFGGVSYGFLPFNDLWKYSAVENAWVRVRTPKGQTPPMQRWLHTAVYHATRDEMVVFGGITAHYVPLNDVHVYSVGTNTWRLQNCLDTPPFPRMMHTAVTVNDIMLVSGGAANNLPMDDMYLLDLKTWRWKELIQTNGYPFARTGATAIVLSPHARGVEMGEKEDMSADARDPHLQWAVDHKKVASRPIVGSFSSEGLDSNEEQFGNMRGLDAIAFPAHPVVDGTEDNATQRPIYRYRKHSKNEYYFVLFGGASATTTPQDQTHVEPDNKPTQQDRAHARTHSSNYRGGERVQERNTNFVEVESTVGFTPADAAAHLSAIGNIRHERTRATRLSTRHMTTSQAAAVKDGVNPAAFGPYDERRSSSEARVFSAATEAGLNAERKQRLGTVRAVGLSRAPFCATFPWCQQTPPPPSLAVLPAAESAQVRQAELARLDPIHHLPIKLDDLKKDPLRFGIVFQGIYDRNTHNEKLKNKMAPAK